MTLIKICGITNLADARYASGSGADYLGFIQYPESPRYVEPSLARDIIGWIHGAEPVGVFVNMPPAEVNRICAETGFAWAQLHGNESPADCLAVDVPVIKAIRMFPGTTRAELELTLAAYADVVDRFLFDTGSAHVGGGTGLAFDWQVLQGVEIPKPWFLAGGLRPDNVGAAIAQLQPSGVDTASGVEESPHQKDYEAIDRFVEAVRGSVANR
ncbi:MAG: phosphoribosylanthranilate isomerase [Bacteroidetes bacterium]|nr:phosphoribosylanthranilate isomerase [Bacteroidota bacterium]